MKLLYILTLLIVASMNNYQPTDAYRILGMFPLNGHSHFVMFDALLKGLAKRGHQVDVVSHFPQKKPIPNYTDISLVGTLPDVKNNLTYDFLVKARMIGSSSVPIIVYMAGNQVCKLMGNPKIQELIRNPPQDPPYDLVITELFSANCYIAFGHHLKVPVIGGCAAMLHPWMNDPIGNPEYTAYIPYYETGFSQRMNFWERLKNTVDTQFAKLLFNYLTAEQDEVLKKSFGPNMPGIRDLEKELSLALVNTHHSLNGVRPLTNAVVEVGGLHVQDGDSELPAELKKWLDESKDGFIYFSFGSMMKIESFPKEMLLAMYESFSKIAPVRVLMKIAKKEELPPGLPNNVHTLPWAPQVPVLKHGKIRAFITHGGLMGTQEAVQHAVPMIGIPLFGDQPFNVNGYVKRKVAVALDYKNITEDNFTAALRTILNDPSYREAAKRLSAQFLDRPMTAMDTAIFWVEYVIRNGNTLRSPAIDLTWWQIALLDVYGALLAVAIAAIYIIKLFLTFLFRRLFGSKKSESKSKKMR